MVIDQYPLQNHIRLSQEEADLEQLRAYGYDVPKEDFERAKAQTIQAHWLAAGKVPPQHTLDFIRKWLG